MAIILTADNGVVLVGSMNAVGKIESLKVEIPESKEFGTPLLKEALEQRLKATTMEYILGCKDFPMPIFHKGENIGEVPILLLQRAYEAKTVKAKPTVANLNYKDGERVDFHIFKKLAHTYGLEVTIKLGKNNHEGKYALTFPKGKYDGPINFCKAFGFCFSEDIGKLIVCPVIGERKGARA
jgi:hypothetical protein